METYVIYNELTGEIRDSGIYKNNNKPEFIKIKLAANKDLAVIYLPDDQVISKYKNIVENGKLKEQELNYKPQNEIYEDLIMVEQRRLAVVSLIAVGTLPEGYI